MNKVEIKARVDFRMKPLLAKGVRILYGKSEFSITDYDFFDNTGKYMVYVSDRVDPFEFSLTEISGFLNTIKRKDKIAIPQFDQDGTVLESKKTRRKAVSIVDEEEDQEDELPEEEISEEEEKEAPQAPVKRVPGKFVHIKSTIEVYVTRDYSLFGILKGNRVLNKNKIKRIKTEIEEGTNLLKYCPIIVVEQEGKLKVIDGQHRLEVAKQLKSNVWYVISDALTLYQIAKMNSNTEKWKAKDFINCYAQTGNTSYVILKEFANTYGFPTSVNLMLLTKGKIGNDGGNDNLQRQFEEGKFFVKAEEQAIKVATEVNRFADFPGHKSRNFIIAICKILDAQKIPMDEVVTAYKKYSDQLAAHAGWKDYLVNLETIVNIGKGKRRVIY